MACADTDCTTVIIPLSAYPRCEFFQRRISCLFKRSMPFIEPEEVTGSRSGSLHMGHSCLTCEAIQIKQHGKLKSKFPQQDFCAKTAQVEMTDGMSFLEIHTLLSAVSYENYIEELDEELGTAKEIDAAMVIIYLKGKQSISETEKLKAHDKIVEFIKKKCPNITCEAQISIFSNCHSSFSESSCGTEESNLIKVGDHGRLASQSQECLPARYTTLEDAKESHELQIFQDQNYSRQKLDVNSQGWGTFSPSKSARPKEHHQLPSYLTKQEENTSFHIGSVGHPEGTIVSPSTNPRRNPRRPISARSETSPITPRRKSLRFSPPGSDSESGMSVDESMSESDTSMSDSQEHRHHTPGEYRLRQKQQQQQQQQLGIQQYRDTASTIPPNIQLSKNNLGKAISYSIESKLFDFLGRVEDKLEEVKEKMGITKDITIVDKLLFELKGLYKQGISKICIEKHAKNKKSQLPRELMDKVLDLPDVIGFGRIYGRLSVHVQRKDIDKKQLRDDVVGYLTEFQMEKEELVIQLMVKKGSWTCITC